PKLQVPLLNNFSPLPPLSSIVHNRQDRHRPKSSLTSSFYHRCLRQHLDPRPSGWSNTTSIPTSSTSYQECWIQTFNHTTGTHIQQVAFSPDMSCSCRRRLSTRTGRPPRKEGP